MTKKKSEPIGRKCKCQATGEWGRTTYFVKKGNKYFKSEEVYQGWLEERKSREEVGRIFMEEILECPGNAANIPYINSKIKSFEKYTYKVLLETMIKCRDRIMYVKQHKQFKNSRNLINYICAILADNIVDVYKKNQQKKRTDQQLKLQDSKITNDFIDELNSSTNGIKHTNKNIKRFLEDGDD